MTTQLIQTEMNNSIAQGLNTLINLNQQVFDFWYSELFDENDDPIMEMWTDKTLNEIEKDVMYNSSADWKMTKDLYTEIIKDEQMTNTFDRDSLLQDYAEQIVDTMDMDTLVMFAMDTIMEKMSQFSDNEIVEEVNEYYPELLEEYNIDPDIYIW